MATIALFGDSTVACTYLVAAQNPALQTYHGKAANFDGRPNVILQGLMPGHTVTNFGLDGLDSSEALSTAFANPTKWALCLASAPSAVIIQFGANDAAAAMPIATFKANLTTMIQQARAANVVPILTSYLWVDYYGAHASLDYNRNTSWGAYFDALVAVAREQGVTLIDTRKAFKDSIESGTWDLFGHNDTTYLAGWENGTSTTQVGFWSNIHPWESGVSLWASTVASRLALTEPLFGGSTTYPGRSDGFTYPTEFSDSIPNIIDDYVVRSDGSMKSRIRNASATITPGAALTGVVRKTGKAGHFATFDATAYATHPVNGLSQTKGAVFVLADTPPSASGAPRLWCWASNSTNLVSIYRSGPSIVCATAAAGAFSTDSFVVPTGVHVFAMTWDSSRAAPPRGFLDGVRTLTTPANAAMPTGLTFTPVIGNRIAGAEYAGCGIQRVVVVSGRVPTDAEMAQVSEAMLAGCGVRTGKTLGGVTVCR